MNKIGARIRKSLFPKIRAAAEDTKNLYIFSSNLEEFLDVNENKRNQYIEEFNIQAVQRLLQTMELDFQR